MLNRKKSDGERLFDICNYAFLGILAVTTLYPFLDQLVISLSFAEDVYATSFRLIPKRISLSTYKAAMNYDLLWIGYRNSIVRTVLGVVLSMFFTALTAYPLAKPRMPFNSTITKFILFTMLFSGGLIPNYLLIKYLGIRNTMWALVLPSMIAGFNVLIVRNFFRTIPESLEESARMDGAGYLTIWARIVIPLSLPVLATVSLWIAVHHWNSWFDAMIYIDDPKKTVLQMVLRRIVIDTTSADIESIARKMEERRTGEDAFTGRQIQATVVMLAIIPMLIVYPFAQKYFVKGIMLGSVKG